MVENRRALFLALPVTLALFVPLGCSTTGPEGGSGGGRDGGADSAAGPADSGFSLPSADATVDVAAPHDGSIGLDARIKLPDDPGDADPADADSVDAAACTLVRPYSSKDAVCNACAQKECCAQINTCLSDTQCDDGYVNCLLACVLVDDAGPGTDAGIAMCETACGAQYPKGHTEYDIATGCVDTACVPCR